MSTIRENILANIKTTLDTITIANGYDNDIASVQRWMQRGNSLRLIPCIIITAGQEDKVPEPNPMMTCHLTVFLFIYLRQEETDVNPTDQLINSVIGDVEKALVIDNTRGGNARNTNIRSVMPFETSEGQVNVGAVIELDVNYQHLQSDPKTVG
jgi:hypothetical protein